MKNPKNDPFINLVLDDDEQMIEQALENNEYVDVDATHFEKTKFVLQDVAKRDPKSDVIVRKNLK